MVKKKDIGSRNNQAMEKLAFSDGFFFFFPPLKVTLSDGNYFLPLKVLFSFRPVLPFKSFYPKNFMDETFSGKEKKKPQLNAFFLLPLKLTFFCS